MGRNDNGIVDISKLQEMKGQMAKRGNWKEVKRINKMISFRDGKIRRCDL